MQLFSARSIEGKQSTTIGTTNGWWARSDAAMLVSCTGGWNEHGLLHAQSATSKQSCPGWCRDMLFLPKRQAQILKCRLNFVQE